MKTTAIPVLRPPRRIAGSQRASAWSLESDAPSCGIVPALRGGGVDVGLRQGLAETNLDDIRLALRPMDRSIPTLQIASHHDADGVTRFSGWTSVVLRRAMKAVTNGRADGIVHLATTSLRY